MTIYDAYRHFLLELKNSYDSSEADAITRILFFHLTQQTRADIVKNPDQLLSKETQDSLKSALVRLCQFEPIQYITGETVFCNRTFNVNPSVLIPRPETEQLVDLAVEALSTCNNASVFEVGSGSGCIAISIKLALPHVLVSSMDVSDEAIQVAISNATKLQADIHWICDDFLNKSSWSQLGMFDLIVSNPPYIPLSDAETMNKNVTEFEPHLALFVEDADPLIFYRQLAELGHSHLTEDGYLMVECHRDLAGACLMLLEQEGYKGDVIKDLFGNDRFVKVTRCR